MGPLCVGAEPRDRRTRCSEWGKQSDGGVGVSKERVFHNNKKQTTTQHMAQNAKEVPFDIPCGNFQVGIREYDRNQNSEHGH